VGGGQLIVFSLCAFVYFPAPCPCLLIAVAVSCVEWFGVRSILIPIASCPQCRPVFRGLHLQSFLRLYAVIRMLSVQL